MNEHVNGASTEWNIGRKAGSFNESASNYIQMCSSVTPQLSFFCISFLLPNSLAQQRLRAQNQLNHRKIQQSFVDLMATNAEIRLLNINVSNHTDKCKLRTQWLLIVQNIKNLHKQHSYISIPYVYICTYASIYRQTCVHIYIYICICMSIYTNAS